ncbi:molybdopterin-dependent oxidoreductase [Chloroflexota bacterium]
MPKENVKNNEVKTFRKVLSWCGHGLGSSTGEVDVKDGKIIRIRPLHYDAIHNPEDFNPGNTWTIKARGKVFEPRMKTLLSPLGIAYKKRVYSPNRIMYPLKRVDWDPNGERNPQNRGKSKYVRISWDEAASIIAAEIKRIHKQYGPYAVLTQGGGHGETKTVHSAHGSGPLLLDHMGGYTIEVRQPDSWEGWFWGAKHVWGMEDGFGLMFPQTNVLKDVSENTEQLIFWGADPETTSWGFTGQAPSRFCYWFTKLGIKQVYISPDLNYAGAIHADKWIPVLPNTDAALHLAIAYTWMTEGTYDKEYLKTHAVGFDKYQDYVLGKEDGVAKTPEWAAKKCGVPEWTIKALARQWASRVTTIAHCYGGGMIRSAYSTEPARLEVLNLAMQGVGKPGVNQIRMLGDVAGRNGAYPWPTSEVWPDLKPAVRELRKVHKQALIKTLVPKGILSDKPISWYCIGDAGAPVEEQFVKYTYPIPKEEGGSEIHMIWSDSPCWQTCWNRGNQFTDAIRSPKIEFFLVNHPWLENDTVYADIVLPSNTKMEEEDIGTDYWTSQFTLVYREGKCVEPLGESKSDYEAVGEVAKKLGIYEEYTGGKTVEEWIKLGYEVSGIKDMVTWEEMNEKGYYIVPVRTDWEKDTVGIRPFYEDPEANPVKTPSGKIEFYSDKLAKSFPDDRERPPSPQWIEKGETHDERLSSERAKKYPLLVMSNHGRWRVHAQHDDISWTREILTCKVKAWDGYNYEPVWINPEDAAARDIKTRDIVKVFNERGIVLCGALVWERIMPGVVYVDHGSRCDVIIPGKVDRGGAINLISPEGIVSKYSAGQATSSYLVEVQKVAMSELEEWKSSYPDAFAREYEPAAGLRFNGWIFQEDKQQKRG